MNRKNAFLLCLGFVAAFAIAMHGYWITALILWAALDSALATRRAGVFYLNGFGTLATARIIQEALDLVFTVRPVLNMISKGFRDDNGNPIASYGQSVITRTFSIPAVGNFLDAAVDRVDTDVPVTLNNFKQVYQKFSLQEISSTSRDLVRESAKPMAIAMANSIVDAVAACWTAANFPAAAAKTIKGAGWDYTHLVQVRGALQKRGVPTSEQRFYAANEDVYSSLLTDPRIISAYNNPANGLAIQNGQLPTVALTRIDEYPSLPVNDCNLVGFSGTPDSVVYASRVPRNPEELLPGAKFPGNLGIVTEPRTGLSVMVSEWIDANLVTNVRLIWMYGVAVGNANNGQIICSA